MTKYRFLLPLAVFSLVCVAYPASSQAYGGCGFDRLGIHGYGYSGSLYGLGRIPTPPYFALHPPVYYGERHYRSYGGSPFARRTARPQAQKIVTKVVINPFVQQGDSTNDLGAMGKTASGPQMIYNPFYEPETTEPEAVEPPAEPEVAEPEVAEPEVVEPEVVEPEVVEPEVVEPEVAEPEVAEPEVVEPEVAEPEVVEPEAAAE